MNLTVHPLLRQCDEAINNIRRQRTQPDISPEEEAKLSREEFAQMLYNAGVRRQLEKSTLGKEFS